MSIKHWLLGAGLIAVIVAPLPASASAPLQCTAADADAAEQQVDRLQNWEALAAFWNRYAGCDQGSIAEGVSEAVARLLVDHWDGLPLLQQLSQRTAGLQDSVLKHIDGTLDDGDLQRIRDQAKHDCPAASADFCKRLDRAAVRALQG